MRQDEHPTRQLLVGALDDELSPEEAVEVEQHLARCADCKREYETLRTLSVRLGAVLASFGGDEANGMRHRLSDAMEAQEAPVPVHRPRRLGQSFAWGAAAIAAGLAIAALSLPWTARRPAAAGAQTVFEASNGAIDVDGESFVVLPYSNPDLPVSAPRIVEMQVPIAALADAGVSFEPVSSEAADSDGSVLADVLIGLDGEPMGIHVLNTP